MRAPKPMRPGSRPAKPRESSERRRKRRATRQERPRARRKKALVRRGSRRIGREARRVKPGGAMTTTMTTTMTWPHRRSPPCRRRLPAPRRHRELPARPLLRPRLPSQLRRRSLPSRSRAHPNLYKGDTAKKKPGSFDPGFLSSCGGYLVGFTILPSVSKFSTAPYLETASPTCLASPTTTIWRWGRSMYFWAICCTFAASTLATCSE